MKRGRMTVTNRTVLPPDQVRKLLRFALAEIDTSDLHVYVRKPRWEKVGEVCEYAGNARDTFEHSLPSRASGWWNRPWYERKRFVIRLSVPKWPMDWPHVCGHATGAAAEEFREWVGASWKPGVETPEFVGRWPVHRFADWRECLVGIAAHEGEHVHQFQQGIGLSEIRCEMAMMRALRRYREAGGADAVLGADSLGFSYT